MRATDLPFNQRISLPDRVDDATEVKMFTLKERLKEVTEEVRSQLDLERSGNLSVSQREGIASLSRRVRSNDIVVFQTDKSGRFAVDTPDNYREAVKPHTVRDMIISRDDHDSIENLLNAHSVSWARFLSAGTPKGR